MSRLRFIEANGVYSVSADAFRFFAFDGPDSVAFLITRAALERIAGRAALSRAECASAVLTHHDRIRPVAEREYFSRPRSAVSVKLTEADFQD